MDLHKVYESLGSLRGRTCADGEYGNKRGLGNHRGSYIHVASMET